MGQAESHPDAVPEEGSDFSLLSAAFLGAEACAESRAPVGEPLIEVVQEGEWKRVVANPSFTARSMPDDERCMVRVLQREMHGVWEDLGPTETDLLLSGMELLVYRRNHVPCEVDMKKMTWRSGCHKGRVREKSEPLGGLARWLRHEAPKVPVEEAAELAYWCAAHLAPALGRRQGALLRYHDQRRSAAARMLQRDESHGAVSAMLHAKTFPFAACAYSGALGRLAIEPALVGSGAEMALQILEMQLSTLPPLAISPDSPTLTTAIGFSEAFRNVLLGPDVSSRPPSLHVAIRVAGLLLRISLQTGLIGPLLVAVTWLLSPQLKLSEAEEEVIRPLVEEIHYINGPREMEIMQPIASGTVTPGGNDGCVGSWTKVPRRYGPMDWPHGPALLQAALKYPGEQRAKHANSGGIHCVMRLAGDVKDAYVGLALLDAVLGFPHDVDRSSSVVMVGNGKFICRREAQHEGQTDSFGRPFENGDEVELILQSEGLTVIVNGEAWGQITETLPAFLSSGARAFISLPTVSGKAEIDVVSHCEGGTAAGAPEPVSWASAVGQQDFETLWRQEAGAQEGRVAAVLLHCIGRNAKASAAAGTPAGPPQKVVEESEHKYSPNMDLWKEVSIPGALKLRVNFDKQCRTERGRDVLTFHRDRTTPLPVDPMSGESNAFRSFEVHGSSFWYNFTSDGSEEYWGYRFEVTPIEYISNGTSVPMSAEGIGTGVTESLELLLQQVSDRRPMGDTSLRGILEATGAELKFLATLQPAARPPPVKAAMQRILRALLSAAEATFPWIEPSNLAETLAVEVLQMAGPEVAGDYTSRLALIVAMLENSSCPPALVSAVDQILTGDEHHAQLLTDPASARAVLARLCTVALDLHSGAPATNRASSTRMLLQVMGDILSDLASSKSQTKASWDLVCNLSLRILNGAVEALSTLQQSCAGEGFTDLLGLLVPALLRGLALALPTALGDLLLPLLPGLSSLRSVAAHSSDAATTLTQPMLEELIASSLAFEQAFALRLARSELHEAPPLEGAMADALRCPMIHVVPSELLGEHAMNEGLSQVVEAVKKHIGLATLASEAYAAHALCTDLKGFIDAEGPYTNHVVATLNIASHADPIPTSAAAAHRLGFAILVRHYGLEQELLQFITSAKESKGAADDEPSQALSLLWKQARDVALFTIACHQQQSLKQAAAEGVLETEALSTGANEMEEFLHFLLLCTSVGDGSGKQLDIDGEEAASSAINENREALETRQSLTQGASDVITGPGLNLPKRSRWDSDIPGTEPPAPPALLRGMSAPLAPVRANSGLRRQHSAVRSLQLSLRPLQAILVAEERRSSEPRPVDQLKKLLQVPLRDLLKVIRARSQHVSCIAASLQLLSAGVKSAYRFGGSSRVVAEALLALRVAWQHSIVATQMSSSAGALSAVRSAQHEAVVVMMEAAAVQQPLGDKGSSKCVEVQALVICSLCGDWGSQELQLVERLAGSMVATALPFSGVADQTDGESAMLLRSCAAWLFTRTRMGVIHTLPCGQREALLGSVCDELLANQPAAVTTADVAEVGAEDEITLPSMFAPLGSIPAGAMGTKVAVKEGWRYHPADHSAHYSIEGPDGSTLRTMGPEIREGMDGAEVQNISDATKQHIVLSTQCFEHGKHYWELSIDECPHQLHCTNVIGVARLDAPAEWLMESVEDVCWGFSPLLGPVGSETTGVEPGDFPSIQQGAVIGVLLNCDDGTLRFFENGQSRGIGLSGLQGKGPFCPCVTVGLSGGVVFTLNLQPAELPAEAEGAVRAPLKSNARNSLGGVQTCMERPALAWLLTVGWVAAAIGKDVFQGNTSPLTARFVDSMLSILLSSKKEFGCAEKTLAGLLLQRLPAPSGSQCAEQLLASMAVDSAGRMRSCKAAVLRHWCAASEATGKDTAWGALTRALSEGGDLRLAALTVVSEPASLRCFSPVTLDGMGGRRRGIVVDVNQEHAAVLPLGPSSSVTWFGKEHIWPETSRCPPPFPAELISVAISTGLAAHSDVCPRQSVIEFLPLLTLLTHASGMPTESLLNLLRTFAPLALSGDLEPELGGAWSAVPAEHRINLCMALLSRPTAAQVVGEQMLRARTSAANIIEDATAPGLLIPVAADVDPEMKNDEGATVSLADASDNDFRGRYYCGRQLGVEAIPGSDGFCGPNNGPQCPSCKRFQAVFTSSPPLWRRPVSAEDRLITFNAFAEALKRLVPTLMEAEVSEMWDSAFTGKRLQVIDANTSHGLWMAAPTIGDSDGEEPAIQWTRISEESARTLNVCLAEGRAQCTISLESHGEMRDAAVDLSAMTIRSSDDAAPRQLTRSGLTEPAIDTAEFEGLLRDPMPRFPPGNSKLPVPADLEHMESEQHTGDMLSGFSKALAALGFPEGPEPRSRAALLKMLTPSGAHGGCNSGVGCGLLRLAMPAPTADELHSVSVFQSCHSITEAKKEERRSGACQHALQTLLMRCTTPSASTENGGISTVACWVRGQLARQVCAKAVAGCNAENLTAIGSAADVVQLLLAVRLHMNDPAQLQELLRSALQRHSGGGQLAEAFQQAAQAEFLGLLREALKPSDPVLVEESEHPYSDNTNLWKEVRIPGARNLQVEFDPRCRTEATHDYLEFCESHHGPLLENVHDRRTGASFQNFEVEGDGFWYHFVSDSSNVDWGFKFTVASSPQEVDTRGYWDMGAPTPNLDDASWLLQTALATATGVVGCAKELGSIRLDIMIPTLLALAQRSLQEETRIAALVALTDLHRTLGGEPAHLWCQLHVQLWTFFGVGRPGGAWSSSVGQLAAALLVRLRVSLPPEPSRLRFQAPSPTGAAMVSPASTEVLFFKDGAACTLDGALVHSGEAASIHLKLSEGVHVGVVPTTNEPGQNDLSQLVALPAATSGSCGRNRWCPKSPGLMANAATLSVEDADELISVRSDGVNHVIRAERAYSTGTHYWEISCLHRDGGGNGYHIIGVASADNTLNSFSKGGCGPLIWGLWLDNDVKVHNNQTESMGCSFRVNHESNARYGVLLDCDAGTLSFYNDGNLQGDNNLLSMGGIAFGNLAGHGPFYPIMCVGCLDSNRYRVNFSPQQLPEGVDHLLKSSRHGGPCEDHLVMCDLRGGNGAAWLSVSGADGNRCETLPLPAAATTWQFVVVGVAGAEAALLEPAAVEDTCSIGRLAKSQDAMEAVLGNKGLLPEILEEAFVTWLTAEQTIEEAPTPMAEPQEQTCPWESLGAEQLVVFGAGNSACNGVFSLLSQDPVMYLSQTEATIVNDRDGHWIISPDFNVETWVYEAPSHEGPWTSRTSSANPTPTVCGPSGPAERPDVASNEGVASGEAGQERPAEGLAALMKEKRSVSISIEDSSDEQLCVPGCDRFAVSLEGEASVEVLLQSQDGANRSTVLYAGEQVEVAGESCILRPLIGPRPGWLMESDSRSHAEGLFGAHATERVHKFDGRGLLPLGPTLLISDTILCTETATVQAELDNAALLDVLCPRRHVMKPRPMREGWHCDKCRDKGSHLLRFRCDEGCNWDFCGKCQLQLSCGLKIREKQVVKATDAVAVGDKVQADYAYMVGLGDQPVKKLATVAEARDDGTFLVTWDDNDTRDREKTLSQLRPAQAESETVCVVQSVSEEGPCAAWNAEHPDRTIKCGDHIVCARGVSGDPTNMLQEMLKTDAAEPLKLVLRACCQNAQPAPLTPALSWPGLFEPYVHEDSGFKFASSPELCVCHSSGSMELGVSKRVKHQEASGLLSVGVLPHVSEGDVLRLLVAINADGCVVSLRLLQNGAPAASWELEEEVALSEVDISDLRLWVMSIAASGPRRQARAALRLLPTSAAGPRCPADAVSVASAGAADGKECGRVPTLAWAAFLSNRPAPKPCRAIAWPTDRAEHLRLLEEVFYNEVISFRAAALEDWKQETDTQLLRAVETLAKERGRRMLDRAFMEYKPEDCKRWTVAGHPPKKGYARYLVLHSLNLIIQQCVLPFLELSRLHETPHGRVLHSLKSLLFSEVRGTSAQPNGVEGSQAKLTLNRSSASSCKDAGLCDADGKMMLFAQASLVNLDASTFRRSGQSWQDQPFAVGYEDEPGVDQGGLYRDFFDAVTEELMSEHLPLFVPTANHSTNAGENRDAWVLNPALDVKPGSPGERMLLFLGRLMGCCLLRGDVLPLSLPHMVWKGLQGEQGTLVDLEAIDIAAASSIKVLREPESMGIDSDSFSDTFPDLKYVVEDSAHQVREVVQGGSECLVGWKDAPRYAQLMLELRLKESEQQLSVLRAGIQEVAKPNSWALWPSAMLEEQIVGVTHIDIELLKQKTDYDGWTSASASVRHFWTAMASFSQADLRQFLHFVWGRSRLPPEGSNKWGSGFKLSKASRTDMLPLAHTCFFQLELPEYATEELMRDRLLFAINNCRSMLLA